MERNAQPTPEQPAYRPRELVLRLLEPPLDRAGIDPGDVDDSFNVVDRGVVDSIEFLDLVATLEDRTGARLDLFDADPEVLTTVGGLASMLEEAMLES